ncbi:HET-domain-containing protein [Neurospora hispaniola]|uniref:HET-domain-containing protein n=1 Tax=Neurospora hispaniola TaxID=588809 RepID=A0AAJ0I4C4_9PEZI|nr:HET-domain-containing protein [Neurospora hispaniola]
MSTRLCAVCNGIFTGLLVDAGFMPHHQSLASLRRSAEEGCYICSSVVAQAMAQYNVFNEDDDDDDAFSWSLYMSPQENSRDCGPYPKHGFLAIWSEHYHSEFNLISTASPDAPICSVNPGASLTDQAVMETARSWLEDCLQNHESCGPVDPAFNPTRLIYIHDESSVQLIETKKEAKSHAYVAFSHCWGKSEALKLLQDDLDKGTRGNIEELRSLIQVQSLPTSYREAISVSLALGFRYIWIDSLCIIQNSHNDWAKEAAMMEDVYANSSLNLCASAAADSSEASFQRRDRGIFVPLDIEPQWTGILHHDDQERKLGPLPSYLHRIKFKLVNASMYNSEITNSPLNLRAWVVQERVLSRRHLFMTCNQLWWECHDMFACEVFPEVFPHFGYGEWERVQYYALNGHGHHSVYGRDMERLWEHLVKRYSRCNLTYLYDKLPALSGLAQAFSIIQSQDFSLDKNHYLAGIWRPHLPQALGWYTKSNEKSGQVRRYRPHPYRAPSWSWVSVEGPVEVNGFLEPACRVVDVKVVLEDEQYKAGTVKGGILHLESHLIGPLTHGWSRLGGFTTTTPLDSRLREAFDTLQFETYWDEGDGDSRDHFISYLDPLPHTVSEDGILKDTSAVRKRVLLEDLAKQGRIRLFMVPLMFDRYSEEFEGSILCQIVNNPEVEGVDQDAVFQRVGYFRMLKLEKKVLDLIPKRTIAII